MTDNVIHIEFKRKSYESEGSKFLSMLSMELDGDDFQDIMDYVLCKDMAHQQILWDEMDEFQRTCAEQYFAANRSA